MVAASFYPAFSAGFVWDDWIFVEAPAVRAWSGLWNIWFSPAEIEREGHYWPVVYTTFWLEHKLWGLDPLGYHVVNVLLHMANVLLLWWLLRCLRVPGAWAAAAVFAVHPIHVESVAWVIGRKDLLSGLLYLASALCLIHSMDGFGNSRLDSRNSPVPNSDPVSRQSWWRWPLDGVRRPGLYLAALAFFAAAMLSKSVAVTLPVAFAILLWWKNGRVTWTDARRIAPLFLVAFCIAVADLSYYTSRREVDLGYGFAERVLIAARALWFYVGKLAWPADLAVIYPIWDVGIRQWLAWGYLMAAAALAALLWFGRHRLGRGLLAGAAFFAVTLSPMLGFVEFAFMSFSLVAERFAYLAGIGVIAVALGAVAHGVGKLPGLFKIGASAVLIAILAVFGRLTWEQAGIYRDDFTFYNHVILLNPGAQHAYRNLASTLVDDGRPEEALAASHIALELRPDWADAHNTHGTALFALDRLDEAGDSFRRALELDPDHKRALLNMAATRRRQGRVVDSVRWYRKVLNVDSKLAAAHVGLGSALSLLGQHEASAAALSQAVSLRPDTLPITAFYLLADVLRRLQRYEEAMERYRDVLEIDPDYAPAHEGIGRVLLQLGRYGEAVESLARSVSLEPKSPAAVDRHVAMGRAFVELGRTEAAAEHYARALEIDSRNAKALDSFAVLRFGQQRYEEALGYYETLIEVGGANARVHANVGATLFYLDRLDEAAESLDRALSLDPTLADTDFEALRELIRQRQE